MNAETWITYRVDRDPETGAVYVSLAPYGIGAVEPRPAVTRTKEIAPGLMLDLDKHGNVIGIEHLPPIRPAFYGNAIGIKYLGRDF